MRAIVDGDVLLLILLVLLGLPGVGCHVACQRCFAIFLEHELLFITGLDVVVLDYHLRHLALDILILMA